MTAPRSLIPTPPELFRLFERGEVTREQLHTAMALHARAIVDEMVEAHRNPVAAYLETIRNRTAAKRLIKQHGEGSVRECLAALGTIEDFAPSRLLWNAGHWDVPLHCFLRTRLEPVFRLTRLEVQPMEMRATVEHGRARKRDVTREEFILRRSRYRRLEVESRRVLS